MDLNEPDIADPDARREQLIDDAKQAKREHDAEQAELLDAVKNDKEFVHDGHEWVEVGDVEFRVRTDLPGDVIDTLQTFSAGDDELPDMRPLVNVATRMTDVIRTEGTMWETEAKIREFWQAYYHEHGDIVLEVVSDRILSPALDKRQNGVSQTFQGE